MTDENKPEEATPEESAPAEPVEPEEAPASAPAEALEFLDATTHDPDNPVVLFALEWCEFCWSVRKMFAHYEIPYRSVDLDSVAYQDNDRGSQIRAVLAERVGAPTIPQIFVGGDHLGGATDTFEAYKSGELEKRLERVGVKIGDLGGKDPYELLPNWLHKR